MEYILFIGADPDKSIVKCDSLVFSGDLTCMTWVYVEMILIC